ncbi:DUF2062 domain-containing protein [Rhizorhapis suberifaciens]|uniref:DUF2062 domain-containing protein n=1 Tax=Rhizorhapis suberifaciens TaxID=13656 RepID=A0A840HQS1_9SPHN|nr:DUF2062 domain-containing protein [Rhizorhapis suberifaciens]MBB4639977.1 hypothetical protein [Rhizorhapis suberifaciens]
MGPRKLRWLTRHMPTHDTIRANRFLAPFANRILAPELWRFTRRSVPRGVALGMLVGIIIPLAQIVFAALLALSCRANVPVAAVTTFITNPITTPILWLVAYKVGDWILHLDAMTYGQPLNTQLRSDPGSWLQWLTGAFSVTAFGLIVLAVIFSAIGYVVAGWGWKAWVARKWRRRHKHRRHLTRQSEPAPM